MKRKYIEDRIWWSNRHNNKERLTKDYDKRFNYRWGWQQEHIARLIDVSRVTVSSLLNGKTKLDINMLIKVRYLTGLSFDAIIKEEIKLGLADNIFYEMLVNSDAKSND